MSQVMKIFNLKIYGIKIKVSSSSDFAFENLKKDFIFYLSGEESGDSPKGKEIKIRVFKEDAPYYKVPALGASLNGRGFICYKDKDAHYVDYAGRGLMVYDFKNEIADIYSKDENLLYEKSRLAILSRTGELLDNRRIHRLHALGLAKDGKATICFLPMEAGKTTLGLGVLKKDNGIKLLSDDICLVDFKNYAYPFILRIGARDEGLIKNIPAVNITKINRDFYGDKYLIDIAYFKDCIAGKSRVCNILIGKRFFKEETAIMRISKIKCFMPFIQSGVFGLGLPQIVELFLRGNMQDILKKTFMVFSRSILFLIVICRSKTYKINIGRDMEKSSDVLVDFINKS